MARWPTTNLTGIARVFIQAYRGIPRQPNIEHLAQMCLSHNWQHVMMRGISGKWEVASGEGWWMSSRCIIAGHVSKTPICTVSSRNFRGEVLAERILERPISWKAQYCAGECAECRICPILQEYWTLPSIGHVQHGAFRTRGISSTGQGPMLVEERNLSLYWAEIQYWQTMTNSGIIMGQMFFWCQFTVKLPNGFNFCGKSGCDKFKIHWLRKSALRHQAKVPLPIITQKCCRNHDAKSALKIASSAHFCVVRRRMLWYIDG
jgi:hypothetical protein